MDRPSVSSSALVSLAAANRRRRLHEYRRLQADLAGIHPHDPELCPEPLARYRALQAFLDSRLSARPVMPA